MFYVVTHTRFSAEQRKDVLDLSQKAVEIAKEQPGFVSIRVHLAEDGSHTMTYWEWETERDHIACMGSDDWAPWNPKWQALLESGVSFDIATYKAIAE
ncbi:antibiotic biosynthesis monooxygenase family protein [Hoeflea sp.]|uniref:antibiotic biosynthesis monooxygenase family protein n=1 Tax=Hoeflea sp. TaxID=1940281 RepID=UPI003B017625